MPTPGRRLRASQAVAGAWCVMSLMCVSPAHAGLLSDLFDGTLTSGNAPVLPGHACRIEQGFSPEGSAQRLVFKALDSADHSIRLAAYSFTSREVVRRLIEAKTRGVDVKVLVDARSNLVEDRSGRARAALKALVEAGIPTRTLSTYAAAHDKFFVVDGNHVESGSYNFSDSAARRNSENALVLWACESSAAPFLDHWQSRWNQGVNYRPDR
jgi:phosphatidylserine/phosphatidylglycerophosphate/cardiolipin synthase-like enzyme